MATLGNVPAEAYTNTVKDSFSGNGSATAFTMSLPTVTNDVRVVVENVIQDPTVAYSVSGTTLTFTSAPPSGTNNIYVVHLGPAVMTTVPPAEIADATTFASSLTVQGAFTSKGIDDNADATALTIDSSERVMIGKTDTTFSTAGTVLYGDGSSDHTRNGLLLQLNRITTDGEHIRLLKDGSSVGSIGSVSGVDLFVAGSRGAGQRYLLNNILPCNASGDVVDNTIDFGQSNYRYKDAYLSGGVYLGGTGSANKLEDYEEGTWTPALNSGSLNISSATYTKVGRLVTLNLDASVATGGGIQINNAPFTAGTTVATAIFTSVQNFNSNRTAPVVIIGGGSSTIYFRDIGDNVSWQSMPLTAGASISFSFTYMTT